MADHVLTKEDLENLFRDITEEITGFSPDGKKGQIRFGYPEEGQPGFERNDDTVCIVVSPVDNPYDKQRNTFENTDVEFAPDCNVETTYTRVFQVAWMVFGPNSYDITDKLKCELLWETALNTMDEMAVAPLTEIEGPAYMPFNFQGRWWERTDLRALFNVGTQRDHTVGFIETVDVLIYTDQGLQRTVHAPTDQPLAGAANAIASVTGNLQIEEP